MPRPLHPCAVPGCPVLIKSGERYCEAHTKDRNNAYNARRREAGYTRDYGSARWRKISIAFLADHPRCAWPGCGKLAEVAHHLVEKKDGGTDEWSNLQALCWSHHSELHARSKRGGGEGGEIRHE